MTPNFQNARIIFKIRLEISQPGSYIVVLSFFNSHYFSLTVCSPHRWYGKDPTALCPRGGKSFGPCRNRTHVT